MKLQLDKKYLKYSLYASLTIIISIIFFQILENLGELLNGFYYGLYWIRRVLSPFIIGAFIAYILNPGVRWFEESLYSKVKYIAARKRLHRFLSILTVYILLISLIIMLIVFVAPQISNNIRDMLRRLPEYVNTTSKWIEHWSNDIGLDNMNYITNYIETNIKGIFNTTSQVLQYLLDGIVMNIVNITSGVLNYLLGLIISLYLLTDKEMIKAGIEKVLRVAMKDSKVDKLKDFGREADDLFGRFIIGKSLDSFIIGVICLIGLKMMNIRYILLLSAIVGVTNMIPYFGPFIGWVPAVIITLFDSPINALWVSIFILVLQQFDGLVLGPKILGDSVGIRPIWIIFSIVVGGKLAGVLGMFLGVPVFSVIGILVNRYINRKLEMKGKKSLEDNHDIIN